MPITAAQREARTKGIGSSDIGAIVGVSPYRGAHSVWREKTGQSIDLDSERLKRASERGTFLEEALLSWYSERHQRKLDTPGTKQHPKYSWMLDHVDAIANDHICVEVKTASWRLRTQWGPGKSDIPLHYLCQGAWHCAVWDLDRCEYPVYWGDDLELFVYERDAELEKTLIERAHQFWTEHVLDGVEPPTDGTQDTADYLKHRYPSSKHDFRQGDDQTRSQAKQLQGIKSRIKELEEQKQILQNQLVAAIGDAAGLQGEDWHVSYKSTKGRTRTDWQAIAKAAGATEDQIARHTRITPGYRRMLIRGFDE